MSNSLDGRYYRFGSSSACSGNLRVDGERCVVFSHEGGVLLECPLSQVYYSQPIASLPGRFDLGEGNAFEVADSQAANRWLKNYPQFVRGRGIGRLELSWPWAIVAGLSIPLIALVAIFWALPWLSSRLAEQMPDEVLSYLDNQILEQDGATWMKPSAASDSERELLQSAWQALGPPEGITMVMRNSKMLGANAFALPGGTVVVTDQLVVALNNHDQLLAVLAHEVGHVHHQHGLRNAIQSMGMAAIIATLVGDVSSLAESLLVTAPTALQQLRYSREFEQEADQFAREWLSELGVPQACLGVALKSIVAYQRRQNADEELDELVDNRSGSQPPPPDDSPAWLDYLSTHPSVTDRVQISGRGDCP